MNYQEQISPWVLHQLMPNMKHMAIARFRHRTDAEGYLNLMSRMMPHLRFTIAFEHAISQPVEPKPVETKRKSRSSAKKVSLSQA